MSWVRIWIHLVFSTKERQPFIAPKELKDNLIQHIKENAKLKDIWIDSINGNKDHLHILISLNKEQSISKVSQLIKGESSFWMNKNYSGKNKFVWQDDYWAVSVSESHLEATREYINNQEAHHKTTSFTNEVNDFMKKYGWELIQVSN